MDAGRVGLRGGGHTIFDNTYNPSIFVVGDFALVATDQEDSFEFSNQFRLRAVEIGIVGRVDSVASYNVIIHVDDEEIELEEAYAFTEEWLPFGMQLKGGRYNIDFGKLSRVHDHGLPFADKPSSCRSTSMVRCVARVLRSTNSTPSATVPSCAGQSAS